MIYLLNQLLKKKKKKKRKKKRKKKVFNKYEKVSRKKTRYVSIIQNSRLL